MATNRIGVGYGLSQALLNVPVLPVVALVAPPTSIQGYPLGQIWINKATSAAYILTSTAANVATWVNIAVASGASFTTVTSTGQFTLDTTTAAANTLGNTNGATSVTISVGTGGFTVDGVPSSAYAVGASTTTGTLVLGGTAQTGAITLGSSSGTNIVNVGTGAGATTVNIASGVTNAKSIFIGTGAAMANNIALGGTGANVIIIGDVQTGGAISLGAAMTTGTLNLGSIAAGTGAIVIGGGTGNQTISIAAAGTGTKTIAIGANGSQNNVGIGSTTAGSTIALRTPAGTPVTSAAGYTATAGNITATNGDVVLSTATNKIQLPGPIFIMSGAGVPANGLAIQAGDTYFRTDPAGATSRIYIATGAGAWTNVTCAA